MTCQNNCTLPEEILEQIAGQGLDSLPEMIHVVTNAAMKAERQRYLGVAPYECQRSVVIRRMDTSPK
ncbi:MAG: hypothetical protein Fur0043_28210 [Anaerolineales bacterium]